MRMLPDPRVVIPLLVALGSGVTALPQAANPISVVQGTGVGAPMFEPGDTPRGGIGQAVDGIEGSSREMLRVHIHAHLSIFYDGRQIAVPYGIGIVRPFQIDRGFVGRGNGFYWLHTHDATGIMHIESPDERTYTLGNFPTSGVCR